MKAIHKISVIFHLILILCFCNRIKAQQTSELSQEEITLTIDSINSKLHQLYVFPDVASKMANYLRENVNSEKYASFTNPEALATQLTTDLYFISKDKHLRVYFDPKEVALERDEIPENERAIRQRVQIQKMEQEKFGFETVKMLEGRIGYLDLRAFMDTQFAAKAAHKAMSRLTHLDAIIIDLRENFGGSPSMIQLLSSYFFKEPVHLNSFYFRPTDEYTETWTLPKIPGKRRPDIDLYILTSGRTFSAAEEFSYNMKHLKRATLIGEITAGGAHPGGPVSATDLFRIWMPQGRAINPITNTNWEGSGVKPDINVEAERALMVAHVQALEQLQEEATDPALLHSYNLTIPELKRTYKLEQSKYADVLVDAKYEPWNDAYDTFYGDNQRYMPDSSLSPINPRVVLGNTNYYVTLPKGSYITIQFTDNFVVDTPNQDDLFIDEVGKTGDQAAVHVSSDGTNFTFLGIANGGKTNSMDLGTINFKGIVRYVKVMGLDLNGASPGFDVVRIYGLPNSNIDKYVAEDEIEKYLNDPNIYNRGIILKSIEFEFESHELLPVGTAYLDKIINLISVHPKLKLKIIGHTDDIGTETFNDQLSEKRAKTVYDYFVERGINPDNLTYEGRGTREPLMHNNTEEGRKRNRRVELVKVQ